MCNVGRYTSAEKGPDGEYVGLPDAFSGHLYPDRFESPVLYRNLGQRRFKDVSAEVGLRPVGWSGDAGVFDLNGDGWPDIYVLNMQGDDHYFENVRGRAFTEKTTQYFPKTPWGSMGVKFFDYDNDGLMDLLVTDMHSDMSEDVGPEREKLKSRMRWPETYLQGGSNNIFGNALFHNLGGGRFEEASDRLGVENYWPWGFSVGDLNADGWEDVFITSGMGFPYRYGINTLLLNNRGEKFLDSEFLLGVEPRPDGHTHTRWCEIDCSDEGKGSPVCQGRTGTITLLTPLSSRSSSSRHPEGLRLRPAGLPDADTSSPGPTPLLGVTFTRFAFVEIALRASRISSVVCQRLAGSFSSPFRMTASSSGGIFGFTLRGRGGACWMCAITTAIGDSPLNGSLPVNDLEEHHGQRVEVGAEVGGPALRLLGRHVVGRAHHRARGGEPSRVRLDRGDAGDPEVHDLELGRLGEDQHVLGLDVPVDDAALVGGPEPVAHLLRDREADPERQRAAVADEVLEGHALEVLHRDVGDARGLAEVVGPEHVAVRDAPGELDLLLEALEEGRVAREGLGPQQLEGHDLVELPVARAVHDAHAALAQRAEDLVAVGEDLPAAEDGAGGRARRSSANPPRGWPPGPGSRPPPPRRRRWARAGGRCLAHRRHALAQERDHLVLLAQVGEQAVEGAGQDADLVPALHRDGAGVGAVADPLDQAHELAHGPGDARGGAPGGEEPQGHDAERHEHEAVAELAEGGGLRGEAAQGERGPDLLAALGLQRYPHADVAVAVEVDLEGRHLRPRELRAGEGGGEGASRAAPATRRRGAPAGRAAGRERRSRCG